MAWRKGQSGNPGGRPKGGNGLAEVIRKKLDPEVVFQKLWDIAENAPSEQTRLRALELLMERGWKKPAQVVEVGPTDPFEDMSDEELAQLRAEKQAILMGTGAVAYLPDGSADHWDESSVLSVRPETCVDTDADVVQESPGEARAPSSGAEVRECRTTSHVVGAAPTQHPGVLRRKP
jgi:hypothetical protein